MSDNQDQGIMSPFVTAMLLLVGTFTLIVLASKGVFSTGGGTQKKRLDSNDRGEKGDNKLALLNDEIKISNEDLMISNNIASSSKEIVIGEQARLLKNELIERHKRLAEHYKKASKFSEEEWREFHEYDKKATRLIKESELDGAAQALDGLQKALEIANSTTDGIVLLARFLQVIDLDVIAGSSKFALETYNDCCNAGFDPVLKLSVGAPRSKAREKLGLAKKIPENFEKIDSSTGAPHAWARHTREGIWEAQVVLTDHPDRVSIFASQNDFKEALNNTPRLRSDWRDMKFSRYDTDYNGVHYQGTALGATMALFSFYPVGGSSYSKKAVSNLLQSCRNFKEFNEELDKF